MSTIIVAHDSLPALQGSLPALVAQLSDGDELIVVDSGSRDPAGLRDLLARVAPGARLLTAPGNVGFAAGANLGVRASQGELIVLLNPDAVVESGWASAMRAAWGSRWDGWMALVLMDGGASINTSGGILHFTGLAWSGQVGEPVSAAPRAPGEVAFLSGACLALSRAKWQEIDGLPERFFMYCEDVDLSLRIRLEGGLVGVVPEARVVHDYEFEKGPTKWRLLERNRVATVMRTYPGLLLALILPALVATEAAIWLVALRGGWVKMKALATIDVVRMLPALARERRAIQAMRRVSELTFAAGLTAELSSPYLGRAAQHPVLSAGLRIYWELVCYLLRVADGLRKSGRVSSEQNLSRGSRWQES